ncbi:hypothetical protein [Thalassospira sp. UBA1131]|jgi:hypothetical protein|uniref:hypothetical protein n=1 Tax=Thalassospira sp. UBA1131 TaxID=1947672 RepID=UPI0025E353E5|nr:hypothetical protein [Thalassospira sp. UBA1131]
MDFDWKSIVKTVAPVLGTAIGGPLGGLATRTIAGALLGDEDATEDQIAAAVQSASPDQLLALKKAEQDFKVQMRKLDIDIERIHQQDRDSARNREVKTGDTWTPRLLAIAITVGFFGILSFMVTHALPETGRDALLVMLGSLGTAFAGVIAYYFGSSSGSKSKDAAMHAAISRPRS